MRKLICSYYLLLRSYRTKIKFGLYFVHIKILIMSPYNY